MYFIIIFINIITFSQQFYSNKSNLKYQIQKVRKNINIYYNNNIFNKYNKNKLLCKENNDNELDNELNSEFV